MLLCVEDCMQCILRASNVQNKNATIQFKLHHVSTRCYISGHRNQCRRNLLLSQNVQHNEHCGNLARATLWRARIYKCWNLKTREEQMQHRRKILWIRVPQKQSNHRRYAKSCPTFVVAEPPSSGSVEGQLRFDSQRAFRYHPVFDVYLFEEMHMERVGRRWEPRTIRAAWMMTINPDEQPMMNRVSSS
jgi:hypothetical protein